MQYLLEKIMRKRSALLALVSGLAAPTTYVAAIFAAGLNRPGYSHFEEPVSALMAGGGGGPLLLGALYAYNLLLLLFGFALAAHAKGRDTALFVTGIAAVGVAIPGVLMLIFPMDVPGTPPSVAGLIHILMAGIGVLGTMAAIAASAYAWRSQRNWRLRNALSWSAIGLLAASGIAASASMAMHAPFTGLMERITIGTFLVWMAATATAIWLDVYRAGRWPATS